MQKNEIKAFENEELGLSVRTVLNEDGSISVNAEDTAIGFGWVQEKKGKIYPRWETLNGFCLDLGFPNKLGKDDFIPESLYYLLGMKANNERAQKYQRWLAMEVLPTLRKTGSYEMPKKQPEKKKKNLSAANMLVKTVSGIFKDAGVDPMFIAAEYELWYTGRKYKGGYGYEKVFNWSLWDVFGRLFGWGQYFTGAVRKCSGRKRSV